LFGNPCGLFAVVGDVAIDSNMIQSGTTQRSIAAHASTSTTTTVANVPEESESMESKSDTDSEDPISSSGDNFDD
jgi:hypothetical protein